MFPFDCPYKVYLRTTGVKGAIFVTFYSKK